MFINNKYRTWYYSIINNALIAGREEYVEKHHIIPKSLGGSNSAENIVRLTAKEHLLCHKLLVKITEGRAQSKMQMALWAMATLHSPNHSGGRKKLTVQEFAKAREAVATNTDRKQHLSVLHSGERNPFYGQTQSTEAKEKMSIAKKGKYTEEKNHFFGKTHSESVRQRISNARKNTQASEETKEKMRASQRLRQTPEARALASEVASEAMKKLLNEPVYREKRGWAPGEATA